MSMMLLRSSTSAAVITAATRRSFPAVLASRSSSWCRFKSTTTAIESNSTTTTSTSTTRSTAQPTLVRVPSLPIVGSLWQPHSGIPVPFEQSQILDFWPAMHQNYGDFYEMGLPGVGTGLSGTMYVIQDPLEMASVLRDEGQYPFGAAQFQWAFARFFQERQMAVGGLLQHGLAWKRMRRFIQSDLLSPQAAARYVPAILEAAEAASKGAPHFAANNNLNQYLNLASFDMFSGVMLGTMPRVSDPTFDTSIANNNDSDAANNANDDRLFCEHVAKALSTGSQMVTKPTERIWNNNMLGFKSASYREFEKSWTLAQDLAGKKTEALYKARLNGTLTDKASNAYANQMFTRQASEDMNPPDDKEMYIQLEEAKTIVGGLLSAGVDTTGGMLSFKLVHLASSPEVQDKLWHALQPTLQNGKLTRESLTLPYLTAILRESHRLANANILIPMKPLPKERPIHGHVLAKGSVLVLDTYSQGFVQDHFEDNVAEFIPERFSKDAVAARKGTRHQIMDHSFFSGPFSQGARKCPGSRVANLEAHALVAQWVLDYTMELPPSVKHFSDVPYDQETLTTAKVPGIQFTPRK